MERFNALGRGMQIMLVGSVLLLIDTFFNWQEVSIEFLGTKASSGVSAWHGFWGVVMGLLVIVLLAWLVARLAAVNIPVPVTLTGATLGFLIFAFALIKNLVDDYSTVWSYIGVGLAALIAVGGWLQVQESGGVENLRTEASSVTGAVGGAGAGGAAATAESAPPPAPQSPPVGTAPAAPPAESGGISAPPPQAPAADIGESTISGASGAPPQAGGSSAPEPSGDAPDDAPHPA